MKREWQKAYASKMGSYLEKETKCNISQALEILKMYLIGGEFLLVCMKIVKFIKMLEKSNENFQRK